MTADSVSRSAGPENTVRFEQDGVGIYVWPHRPDWCVPTSRGDFILRRLVQGHSEADVIQGYAREFDVDSMTAAAHLRQMTARVSQPDVSPYAGRAEHLELTRLKECWLHVTDRCNARCTHCMFSCSPRETAQLETGNMLSLVREASDLGCGLFYFTGGEPFVHDGLVSVCETILRDTAAHVVILTNAVAVDEALPTMTGWDRERVHFQVSVDGQEQNHDAVRGSGAFKRLRGNVSTLRSEGFHVTLAMAVHRGNLAEMPGLVSFAREHGVGNVHYLWLFTRGEAKPDLFVSSEEIRPQLIVAAELAERESVLIDNIEILKSQVFSLAGTRFDLSNAGWESLAIASDGSVYPSPALIQHPQALCGRVDDGLETVWRNSPRLAELRQASIAASPECRANPLRFLIGGGDIDHSLSHGGELVGHDPYVPLYNGVAKWLIAREAQRFPDTDLPGIRLRMGDRLHECGEEGNGVFFTHSNCVLSLPGKDGHTLARDFYARAAEAPNEEIVNPVQYGEDEIAFIPEDARVRSYGCGSPIMDANLQPGETVMDLGSGAGVECFIASSQVGAGGQVIGVDMLPEMITRARQAAASVGEKLGYHNVMFCRGLLEGLPVADHSVDCVVSNCVINLSPEKRRAFHEVFRALKPGGRLVISDVVSEDDIPLDIQYSEKLRGECLGGAFKIDRLFQLLADVGFRQATIIKRFPYREVRGHQFYSVTYSAAKPPAEGPQQVMYRGPFAAVVTDDGQWLERGQTRAASWQGGPELGEPVFVLDADGNVTNVEQQMTCACFTAPEEQAARQEPAPCCWPPEEDKREADCMVCGVGLQYLEGDRDEVCHYCGEMKLANAVCENGHFVCDPCHSRDALEVIESHCLQSTERDMVALMKRIRRHVAVPVNGPEHHSLVPAIVVTAYRNAGGNVSDNDIRTAIQRGATVVGGACAFMGVCGAVSGVGIGLSIILGVNPVLPAGRQAVQQATGKVLAEISKFEAARCCQRDCWIALRVAAELSQELLSIPLAADADLECSQFRQNRECIRGECPLWPSAQREATAAG